MIIWIIDIPLVLLLVVGLVVIVGAKMLAEAVLTMLLYPLAAMMVVGVIMLAIAFALFWVTVVMQHYDQQKTNACDRIMRVLGVRGAIMSVVGFVAFVALNL